MHSSLGQLSIAITMLIGATMICCSGCGALGAYSLAHSVLAHNHVLKPVLPDEPDLEDGASGADRVSVQGRLDLAADRSSLDEPMPMESCHHQDGSRPPELSDGLSGD
jgi:hypothetical protein